MTKLDLAIDALTAARALPELEQARLADAVIETVREVRRQRRLALLDWIDGQSPMKGRSEEFIESAHEFRDTFALGDDDAKT